jgi:hypothetical protein
MKTSLNFPLTRLNGNPLQPGDQYTGSNGVTYTFDGVKWNGYVAAVSTSTNSIINNGSVVQVDPVGDLVLTNYTFPVSIGTNGQVLTWPSSGSVLVWSTATGSGNGNASITVSDMAPDAATTGTLWWDEVSGNLFIAYNDEWIAASITPISTSTSTAISLTTSTLINGSAQVSVSSSGTFFIGDTSLATYGILPNTSLQIDSNIDNYNQISMQNHSSGVNASSDVILYADNSVDYNNNYLDLGINSSGFTQTQYSIYTPGSAYLYSSDSDLFVGTAAPGTNLVFHAGGTTGTNSVGYFNEYGWKFNRGVIVSDNIANQLVFLTQNVSTSSGASAVFTAQNDNSSYIQVGVLSTGNSGPGRDWQPSDTFITSSGSGQTLHIGGQQDLRFYASTQDSNIQNPALWINSTDQTAVFGGNVLPQETLSYSLGSISSQWSSIYPALINFTTNTNTLNPPVPGGATDRIRLWDFNNTNPSRVNYAIGAEGSHIWFATDVIDNTGGFKFYSTTTQVFKIGGDGSLIFADSSVQTTAWTGNYTTSTLSATATDYYSSVTLDPYLNINLNQNGVEVGYLGFDSGNDFYITDRVAGGNILLQTLTTGSNQLTWTFGNNGTLTLPDGSTIGKGEWYSNNGVTLQNHDSDFSLQSGVSASASGQAAIHSQNDSGSIQLSVTTDSHNNIVTISNNSNNWTFGSDGSVTFPDSTVQTTAYTGTVLTSIDGGAADNSAGITITTYTLQNDQGQYDNSGSVTYNIRDVGATAAGVIINGLTVSHTQTITGDINQGDNVLSWSTIDYQLWEQVVSVIAYVVDSRGYTFYTVVQGMYEVPHGPCLVEGTMITMADGSHKAIENIVHGELIRVWNFDLGEFSEAQPIWIKDAEETTGHDIYTFSDGTQLRTVGHHVFNKQAGAFTKLKYAETPVGTTTFNEQGLEVTLVSKERVIEPTRYYNVWTQYHLNLFADGILTSNRFNNIYPIVDMKFVKDDRPLRDIKEFAGIDEKYVSGLRLLEQSHDYTAEYISDYVHNRLERLDITNTVKQGI